MEGMFSSGLVHCALSNAFAFQLAFGVPYSVCGCAPDVDEAPSSLSKMTARLSSKGKGKAVDSSRTPLKNKRPDLVSTDEQDADSFHPSEHQVAYGDPEGKKAHELLQARQQLTKQKYKDAHHNCSHSKTYSPWTAIQVQRNERNAPREGHREAFTDDKPQTEVFNYWGVGAFPPIGYVLYALYFDHLRN